METKKENKLSFLDVEITWKQDTYITTVYRKLYIATFSGVYLTLKAFFFRFIRIY